MHLKVHIHLKVSFMEVNNWSLSDWEKVLQKAAQRENPGVDFFTHTMTIHAKDPNLSKPRSYASFHQRQICPKRVFSNTGWLLYISPSFKISYRLLACSSQFWKAYFWQQQAEEGHVLTSWFSNMYSHMLSSRTNAVFIAVDFKQRCFDI